MAPVRLRCLGGFELWHEDRPISGLESQKVKALFVFLGCQRERAFSRDYLCSLLWPEKSGEAARRNLRQALYNIKQSFGQAEVPVAPILADGDNIQIDPQLDLWSDVHVFDETRRKGSFQGHIDPHSLAAAAGLYRGDFLRGFRLTDCFDYEEWALTEQERLRDAAIENLRNLVDNYLRRGETRLGTQYAHRLISIDPLSEEAHRRLIELYAISGQRSRALSEYRRLAALLEAELGVEPLEETKAVIRSSLDGRASPSTKPDLPEQTGPLIPMVGRDSELRQLSLTWEAMNTGKTQLTVVEGEQGIGKSRFVKSFLDAASSGSNPLVLNGRCFEGHGLPYQPFREILMAAAATVPEIEPAIAAMKPELFATLLHLQPELSELYPDLPQPDLLDHGAERTPVFDAIVPVFEAIFAADAGQAPVIIFLDNLHWAGPETFELVEKLGHRFNDERLWIIATVLSSKVLADSPLFARATCPADRCQSHQLELGRLEREDLGVIAHSLVRNDQAEELADFLSTRSEGQPLALVEWINYLWDEGILVSDRENWQLTGRLDAIFVPSTTGLAELVLKRVRRLPNSTRRMVALAAIIGPRFDAELLQQAADEHMSVVEIGLQILIERWLVRQATDLWASAGRVSCLSLWEQGRRRGVFEFAHESIWRMIYEDLDPARRQIMHREIAFAIEAEVGTNPTPRCEELAFHFGLAHHWGKALSYLELSAQKALRVAAIESAHRYYEKALERVQSLTDEATTAEQRNRWRRERDRILDILDSPSR